jgi:hypothetical protein
MIQILKRNQIKLKGTRKHNVATGSSVNLECCCCLAKRPQYCRITTAASGRMKSKEKEEYKHVPVQPKVRW